MTRRAAAFLVASCALLLGPAQQAKAEAGPPRQALILTLSGISFEQAMKVPELRQLARIGGAGLMTTFTGRGENAPAAYATMWAGVPSGPIQEPSLLYRVLRSHRIGVCQNATNAALPEAVGRVRQLSGPQGSPSCIHGWELDLRGGAGFIEVAVGPGQCIEGCTPPPESTTLRRLRDLSELGAALSRDVRALPNVPTLVAVVAPAASPSMSEVGDEVTPAIVAVGLPDQLFPAKGALHGLTTDTTRQDGLVANVDVAPTILQYFGIPIPAEMDGEPIRRSDGPAPFALHRLELEHRRTRVPVQLSVLGFIIVAFVMGVAAMVALAVGRLSRRVARRMRFLTLWTAAILLTVAAGGLLPHHTYAYVVPFLVLLPPGIAALSLTAGSKGPLAPLTILGALGLAFVIVDALFGWRAMRVPLYGGTMFDGGRYYGLPNAFLPLVFAGALFVVWPLRPMQGFAFLLGVGLFVGFPSLGADVGGAITLFAAAGLWGVLRSRRTVRLRDVIFVAAVVVGGLAVVLLANRFLAGAPTHATRFVERAGTSVGSAFDVIRHRLGTAAHQVITQPTTLIPLVGLPVVLTLVIGRPGPLGPAMDLDRRWRDAMVVLILASFVAFFANDTGASASAPAFLYAMAGMVYPAMLVAERSRP